MNLAMRVATWPLRAVAWVALYAFALAGCLVAIPALWAWGCCARVARRWRKGDGR